MSFTGNLRDWPGNSEYTKNWLKLEQSIFEAEKGAALKITGQSVYFHTWKILEQIIKKKNQFANTHKITEYQVIINIAL